MPSYLQILMFGAPLVVIGVVFLTLHLMTRLSGDRDLGPGWQLRCTRCGTLRDAGDAGLVRLGAFSFKKFVFGRCSRCRGWRWIAVERKPQNPGIGASSAIAE